MEEKIKKWTDGETLAIIDAWKKYLPELKSTKRNAHVYKKIARELTTNYGVLRTAKQAATKIENMCRQYRKEKADSAAAGGTSSKWRFFDSIHTVLTSAAKSDAEGDASEPLEVDEIPEWLSPDPSNPTQAMCKCCLEVIGSQKEDIQRHAETLNHQRKFIKVEPGEFDSFSEEPWVPVETVMPLSSEINETGTQTMIASVRNETTATQTTAFLIGNGSGVGVQNIIVPMSIGTQTWSISVGTQTRNSEDSCYSYGNGHVYPQETSRSTGHTMNWSKAQISKPAPNWEGTAVVKNEFKEIKLADYRGKYVVFFFYPLDFTFVCPTEIIAFSDRVNEFHAINTEVIACSVDSPFTHLAWINTPRKVGGLGPINIPILSDLTHQISKDYGVFLQDLGHTLRGLFIIDDKGVLRQITMNDLPVGRSVEETIRLVQAFQYTDKYGEVCPAGWKPGSETIIPNPADKLKYFGKVNE